MTNKVLDFNAGFIGGGVLVGALTLGFVVVVMADPWIDLLGEWSKKRAYEYAHPENSDHNLMLMWENEHRKCVRQLRDIAASYDPKNKTLMLPSKEALDELIKAGNFITLESQDGRMTP